MGYKVKWVEENLGVTRKALINFELKGLMPKNDGGYRDYSDEDIERIWKIRVLQGIGFTVSEILKMTKEENFDFDSSIQMKIGELEKKREKINKHLGYAKTIKTTGRFPSRPKVMGSVNFEEFYEKSLNDWNINNNGDDKVFLDLFDKYSNLSPEDFEKSDVGKVFKLCEKLQNYPDLLMDSYLFPREIAKRKNLGTNHSEVQLLVKMLYDSKIKNIPESSAMSLDQFVRFESSAYKSGDVARMNRENFGEDGCDFIADAIAVFGGYENYNEIRD